MLIQALKRTPTGQWVVQLRGVAESFPVSRRQLLLVRAHLRPPGRHEPPAVLVFPTGG